MFIAPVVGQYRVSAETVEFGDGFDFNCYAHKISWQSSVVSWQRIAGEQVGSRQYSVDRRTQEDKLAEERY